MTDKEKIEFANTILNLVETRRDKSLPKTIGYLNRVIGQQGFKKCEVGTNVFEDGDRYFIIMESLDGKTSVRFNYHKEELKPFINETW